MWVAFSYKMSFILMTSFTFYSKKPPTTNNIFYFLEPSAIQKYDFLPRNQILFSLLNPVIQVKRVYGLSVVSGDRMRSATVINPSKFKVFDYKKNQVFFSVILDNTWFALPFGV